jgi:putative FmdB family regulatory protein
MPTYDYRCAKCHQDIEVWQSFSEVPLTKHDGCGGKLAKVISPAGIVLKGSGFYKTDSRSASKSAAKAKEKTDTKTKEPAANGSSTPDSSSSSSSVAASSDSGSSSGGEAKSA